jgi:hypothetical protein
MAETTCQCREGWICEAHGDQPWPYDDCREPASNARIPTAGIFSAPRAASTSASNAIHEFGRSPTVSLNAREFGGQVNALVSDYAPAWFCDRC